MAPVLSLSSPTCEASNFRVCHCRRHELTLSHAGLRNLVNVVSSHPHSRAFFCSSTAAVLGQKRDVVPESVSFDPHDAVSMGYARSKFVAEAMCASAFWQFMNGRIGILRLGQLSADTAHGVWKVDEGWPLLISSFECVGCLPNLNEVRHALVSCYPTMTSDIACTADDLMASDKSSRASCPRRCFVRTFSANQRGANPRL